MKEIKLTQGRVALVDDEDFESLNKFKWYTFRGWKDTKYAARKLSGSRITIFMHNIILPRKDGFLADHRDGDGLNNIRDNLRYATPSENSKNRSKRSNTVSKYKGVKLAEKKYWMAEIGNNGVHYHLGFFKTEFEAALKYDEAARKYHGEFARTNF